MLLYYLTTSLSIIWSLPGRTAPRRWQLRYLYKLVLNSKLKKAQSPGSVRRDSEMHDTMIITIISVGVTPSPQVQVQRGVRVTWAGCATCSGGWRRAAGEDAHRPVL